MFKKEKSVQAYVVEKLSREEKSIFFLGEEKSWKFFSEVRSEINFIFCLYVELFTEKFGLLKLVIEL